MPVLLLTRKSFIKTHLAEGLVTQAELKLVRLEAPAPWPSPVQGLALLIPHPWWTHPCRRSMKYTLCSDNHGIKPPTPEQYLTPLQQKEVCIRHLKARLKDTQDRLQDR